MVLRRHRVDFLFLNMMSGVKQGISSSGATSCAGNVLRKLHAPIGSAPLVSKITYMN